MLDNWDIDSWKKYKVTQQPKWPNSEHLNDVINDLKLLPSIVFSGESRHLKKRLIEVENGKAFILQAGNCAEAFTDCTGPEIHNFLRIMLALSEILELELKKPVIKIGRIAGQYGKPRSNDFENINGVNLPVFRGENINSTLETLEARLADPLRLKEGYFRSVATLNLIRAFTQGSYFQGEYRKDWYEFPFSSNLNNIDLFERYKSGISMLMKKSEYKSADLLFISHEALVLDYESAFTRVDTIAGNYYNTSAHFLWLGDRTRDIDSAHVEYLRGINNPLGIKVGPNANFKELVDLIKRVNPINESGKIVLIVRFGILNFESLFNELIKEIKKTDLNVSFMIDPMHGNTKQVNGKKIRLFDDIFQETKRFIELCVENNVYPGGLHLEMTSKLVTECVGGEFGVEFNEVEHLYESLVDPRLNGAQVIELIIKIAKLLNK
jgi:3-deoxy-7-phosphoheptulonate synthase